MTDLQVKAFHNGREIYFLLSYEDETNNESIGVDRFSDGAAIMFPLGDQIKPENIMMGFQGKVNIWHWRALEDREWREGKIGSSVTDLFSEGIGTLAKRDEQRVMGRGFRKKRMGYYLQNDIICPEYHFLCEGRDIRESRKKDRCRGKEILLLSGYHSSEQG